MKNLIEELRNLDGYEYKVSDSFSKKVMKKIKKNKKVNRFSNVISLASIGVVACLAVVLFSNSNIKTNLLENASADNNNKTEDIFSVGLNSAYFDSFDASVEGENLLWETTKENSKVENFNNTFVGDSLLQKDDGEALKTDLTPSVSESLGEKNSINYNPNNRIEISEDSSIVVSVNRKDYEKEIIKILENAKLDPEYTEDGIKVEATKEEVEDLLKDFDIIIKILDKYVVIKLK